MITRRLIASSRSHTVGMKSGFPGAMRRAPEVPTTRLDVTSATFRTTGRDGFMYPFQRAADVADMLEPRPRHGLLR